MALNVTLKDASTNDALYPQTLMANIYDAPSWIKTANKPSYTLDEVVDGSTRKLSDYILANLNDTTSLGTIGTTTGLSAVGVDSNGDLCVMAGGGGASAYSDLTYSSATQSTSGAVSIDGTIPLHVITCTGNVTGVTLSSNPSVGHSCHVIFTATDARTVAIAHNATNSKCPKAANLSLSITANGYVEVDFLNIDNVIYVRGV